MGNIYTSAAQLIGRTPLLELTHIEQAHALEAKLVAKLEFFNPAGSVKDRIAKQFGALCCEMEGAAIAQACWLNGVAFVVVRAISDKADGSDVVAYPVFEEQAAQRCAAIVGAVLEGWTAPA